MICDTHTCAGCQYLEDEWNDRADFAEFLANCQHAKCKVVRLVRQQISKLQNTQYERTFNASDMHEEISNDETFNRVNDEIYEHNRIYEPHDEIENKAQPYEMMHDEQKVISEWPTARDAIEDTAAPLRSPNTAVDRKLWMLWILNRIRHRARLILTAAAVGVIAWTALVYGVFLGATACGGGRTCFASSFKHAQAKRSLF